MGWRAKHVSRSRSPQVRGKRFLIRGSAMLVGQKIGPFAIDKELGSGAMGTVYRAKHVDTGQRVAIKVMSPGVGSSDTALARFKREAAILKQLIHPNIVRLVASGKFGGNPFYAMEYVEGESLDHVIARRGRLTWEEVIALGTQLCEALQHAHHTGIIHRDLKPSNLMILRDGTVKLMDFGIAKDIDETALTAAHCTVGTASYMSPEQCRGDRSLTHKSDLYSMGVMFYELLTGQKPFKADNPMDMFVQHATGTFERPSRLVLEMPIWLDTLVCQLLEKKPEQRPFDARAVLEALQRIKEKVDAGQSAGVEVAKARRIDRPAMDETDKEVARTLRGKRRKKSEAVPVFRRGWVKGVAIGAALVAVILVLYLTVFKPPSADSLYRQAEALVTSGDAAQSPRSFHEVIDSFMAHHPNHPKAAQMRAWAIQVDLEILEKQLLNRRAAKFPPENDTERAARDALDDEDRGKLLDAAKTWQSLLVKKNSGDREEKSWGLLAERKKADLDGIFALYSLLHARVSKENGDEKPAEPESEAEKLALAAVRAEAKTKDLAAIRQAWDDLKARASTAGDRRWFLLAAGRLRELELGGSAKKS